MWTWAIGIVMVLIGACFWMPGLAVRGFADAIEDQDWGGEFDVSEWREGEQPGNDRNPRMRMAKDLRETFLRDRPDRASVFALLGEPEETEGEQTHCYDLGTPSFIGVDHYFLNVTIGVDGRVSEVSIVQH